MKLVLKRFSKKLKDEKADSCTAVIMSHGNYDEKGDYIECVDIDPKTKTYGKFYMNEILNIYNAENAPWLRGKPKLFLIQACRGGKTFEIKPILGRAGIDSGMEVAEEEYFDIDIFSEEDGTIKASSVVEDRPDNREVAVFDNSGVKFLKKKLKKILLKSKKRTIKIPTDADRFIFYATTPRRPSLRLADGTPFIQAVCRVFSQNAHMEHFEEMAKEV